MAKVWVNDYDKGSVIMNKDRPCLVKAMPYSEVCIHMGVAGKRMIAELLFRENGTVACQLYRIPTINLSRKPLPGQKNPEPFSAPILPSEAGILQNEKGEYYGYFAKEIDA